MTRALLAGIAYFALVFAVGFVLGTLRTLFLIPHLGETRSVLVELPVMLALSYVVARWLCASLAVAARSGPRLVMGGTAFVLLMLGELAVSVFLIGRTPAEHLATYEEMAKSLGLLAQIAFALFPLLLAQTSKR